MNKKSILGVIRDAALGAVGAVLFLMAIGETGANSIKQMRQEDHEAYEEYRQQCEVTLNRALTSLYTAERIVDGRSRD